MGRRASEAEATPAHKLPIPPAAARRWPGTDTIFDLAGRWREALAIAESQEQQLACAQASAASRCPGVHPEIGDRDLIHVLERDRDSWWREVDALESSLGVPALETAANGAWGVVEQISERLLTLQPRDIKEAAIKFGILIAMLQTDHPELETSPRLRAFLDDLEHLAGAPRGAM
jgi:hypothetical protein